MKPATIHELSTSVIEYLKKFDIQVNPSSRIAKMNSSLVDINGNSKKIPSNNPDYLTAKQAIYDMQILHFILEQIDVNKKIDEAYPLLKRLCNDNVQPNLSPSQSTGRDSQCELFFYSICLKANLNPSFNEPDIGCIFKGTNYSLAIKRIKSLNSFEKRIREAGKQIFKTKKTGVILSDVSLATNNENTSLDFYVPEHKLAQALRLRTDHFVSRYQDQLQEWLSHKWVSGVIFMFYDLCLNSKGQYQVHAHKAAIPISDNNRRYRDFMDLDDQLSTGLP